MGAEQSGRKVHTDKYAVQAEASTSKTAAAAVSTEPVDVVALVEEIGLLQNGRGAKTRLLSQGNKRPKRYQGRK